jgi:nitrous oxidase accessory protein NosD
MSVKSNAHVRALTIVVALALAVGILVSLAPTAVGAAPSCAVSNTRTQKSYDSLQAGVDAAKPRDTLEVSGRCVGSTTVAKDITIQGAAGPGIPTLDGDRAGTVVHITRGTTTIDGLKIMSGVANVESVEGNGCCVGGGIAVSGPKAGARLVDSIVTGNSATVFGGGIDVDDGTLTLVDSAVSGNTAWSSGGIDSDFGTITLIGSTVSGNTAVGGTTCQNLGSCAGGIWNFGGTLTLTDSTVSGNTATRRGGGIVNQTPTGGPTAVLTLSGSTTITDNHAFSDTTVNLGGGIWIRGTGTVTTATADWTGTISGNTPDQCSPTVTIGSFICGP